MSEVPPPPPFGVGGDGASSFGSRQSLTPAPPIETADSTERAPRRRSSKNSPKRKKKRRAPGSTASSIEGSLAAGSPRAGSPPSNLVTDSITSLPASDGGSSAAPRSSTTSLPTISTPRQADGQLVTGSGVVEISDLPVVEKEFCALMEARAVNGHLHGKVAELTAERRERSERELAKDFRRDIANQAEVDWAMERQRLIDDLRLQHLRYQYKSAEEEREMRQREEHLRWLERDREFEQKEERWREREHELLLKLQRLETRLTLSDQETTDLRADISLLLEEKDRDRGRWELKLKEVEANSQAHIGVLENTHEATLKEWKERAAKDSVWRAEWEADARSDLEFLQKIQKQGEEDGSERRLAAQCLVNDQLINLLSRGLGDRGRVACAKKDGLGESLSSSMWLSEEQAPTQDSVDAQTLGEWAAEGVYKETFSRDLPERGRPTPFYVIDNRHPQRVAIEHRRYLDNPTSRGVVEEYSKTNKEQADRITQLEAQLAALEKGFSEQESKARRARQELVTLQKKYTELERRPATAEVGVITEVSVGERETMTTPSLHPAPPTPEPMPDPVDTGPTREELDRRAREELEGRERAARALLEEEEREAFLRLQRLQKEEMHELLSSMRPTLGVEIKLLDNIATGEKDSLVVVHTVRQEPPHPAKTAGILPEDALLKWDGGELKSKAAFAKCMVGSKVGQKVELRIQRGSEEKDISVVIEGTFKKKAAARTVSTRNAR